MDRTYIYLDLPTGLTRTCGCLLGRFHAYLRARHSPDSLSRYQEEGPWRDPAECTTMVARLRYSGVGSACILVQSRPANRERQETKKKRKKREKESGG